MERIVIAVRNLVVAKSFFKWVVVLYIIQALLSAFVISASTPADGVGGVYGLRDENGVTPDGHRHMGAIYYYAERPLLASPFIDHMDDDDLWMGDLVRFPSYFYYYVMSFPVRIMMAFELSDMMILLTVRLIGILIGLVGLIAFYRITKLVTTRKSVQNLSTLAFGLTGSFVWLSAAESYDVPSLTLWLLFVWSALRLFRKNDISQLYWMALLFCFIAITKYTYLPFAGLFGVVAAVLYVYGNKRDSVKQTFRAIALMVRSWLRSLKKWQLSLGIIALMIGGVLFAERVGGNLLEYRSFNPDCARIHSHEACMNFGVYARNYDQKEGLRTGERQAVDRTWYEYAGVWIGRYFSSMYVYMGHIYIPQYSIVIIISGVLAALWSVILLGVSILKRVRLLRSSTEWFLAGILGVTVAAQLYHNIGVIMEYGGALYAHQGRYLLSVVGFAYLLFILMYRRVVAVLPRRLKVIIHTLAIGTTVFIIATSSAIPSFLIHAISPDWYSPVGQALLPDWITSQY